MKHTRQAASRWWEAAVLSLVLFSPSWSHGAQGRTALFASRLLQHGVDKRAVRWLQLVQAPLQVLCPLDCLLRDTHQQLDHLNTWCEGPCTGTLLTGSLHRCHGNGMLASQAPCPSTSKGLGLPQGRDTGAVEDAILHRSELETASQFHLVTRARALAGVNTFRSGRTHSQNTPGCQVLGVCKAGRARSAK